ncbi:unnamed protein product, partial [Medioppia subpectinata]
MPDKPDMFCLICGDRATGYHFDGLSCNSCKSFFRRTALIDKKKLSCHLAGTCVITMDNRNYCKECRLNKCFSIGMKTSKFYSDEQKRQRISIIENNRKLKKCDVKHMGTKSEINQFFANRYHTKC